MKKNSDEIVELSVGLKGYTTDRNISLKHIIDNLNLNKKKIKKVYGVYENSFEKSFVYKCSFSETKTLMNDIHKYFDQKEIYVNSDKKLTQNFSKSEKYIFKTDYKFSQSSCEAIADNFIINSQCCTFRETPDKKVEIVIFKENNKMSLANKRKIINSIKPIMNHIIKDYVEKNYSLRDIDKNVENKKYVKFLKEEIFD